MRVVYLQHKKSVDFFDSAKLNFEFTEKPALSKDYDEFCYNTNFELTLLKNKNIVELTNEESEIIKSEIENFANTLPLTSRYIKNAVTSKGKLIEGYTTQDKVFAVAPSLPPVDDVYIYWYLDGDEWKLVFGIDAQGNYLGNVPIDNPAITYLATSPPPSPAGYVWDNSLHAWKQDINVRKQERYTQIDMKRTGIISAGVTFNNHRYDSNNASLQNLTAVISSIAAGIPLPENFVWRTADNENVPHDETTLKQLAGVMMQFVNSCYVASWVHKDNIKLLDNLDAINSYDIDTGWLI